MEGKVKMSDGIGVFYSKDIPENPKAIVVIVHGFAEHSGRYHYVKEKLNETGFGVFRFDNRGHGKTEGEKGYIDSFMELIDTTDVIVDMAKSEFKDIPIFMLGHSMGGFITAAYGVRYKNKLDGQILSGAATMTASQTKGIKGVILSLLNNFAPKKGIVNNLSSLISRDEDVVHDYVNDPLNLKDATLKFYVEFLIKGIKWLNENIDSYSYPCLILHGGDDKIVNKNASLNFYEKIQVQDKSLKIYDGLFHEILNEAEKDNVISDITEWILNRI